MVVRKKEQKFNAENQGAPMETDGLNGLEFQVKGREQKLQSFASTHTPHAHHTKDCR